MTTHRYVSWYRRGLAALRSDAAVAGANPTVEANVTIDGTAQPVTVTLHGPGDVAGLSERAILRRDPAPAAPGADPNGIPFVELWPPDLPWRFSPTPTPGARSTSVTPWIALVVVPAGEPLGPQSGATVPVLATTRGELPDPREAWAWAHVQIEEPPGGLPSADVAAYLRDQPDRAVARLLGVRRLEANQRYRACLVPLFEAGRRAGLGAAIGDAGTAFAWDGSASHDAAVTLPVYDSWLIETGDSEDFETIARRLRARDADDLFAPMQLDVRGALGTAEPVIATTFGVIRPQKGTTTLPEEAAIAAALEPVLATDDAAEPAIGPPLYAAAQTSRENLDGAPAWQRELNLDPRRRAQAAAGAAIVRADQEQLVADARAAVGQLARANAIVRGTQLATLLAQRLHTRHVAPRPAHRIVATLWPVLGGTTAAATAATPGDGATDLLTPAMRRLARPAGPVARGRLAGLGWTRLGRDLTLTVAATPLANAATLAGVQAATATIMAAPLDPQKLAEIHAGLADRAARTTTVEAVKPMVAVNVGSVASSALAAAHPLGIASRTAARISGLREITAVAELQELRPQIDLSRPLSDRLAQLRPEMFAPGLADLPLDTVTVLAVDEGAVRAVLAGANDELSRELAWRGVAVDRRTTLLRQLWNRPTRSQIAHDIEPIDQWTGSLDRIDPGGELTVFIVRSALVRRFPTALFMCMRAIVDAERGRKPDTEAAPLLPVVQGLATPELAYIGFALDMPTLAGDDEWKAGSTADPGYYFAIQERPTHTRFGLDADKHASHTGWPDLSWDPTEVTAQPYLQLQPAPSGYPGSPAWGSSAASMAAITERPAVRVAFHVQELLVR